MLSTLKPFNKPFRLTFPARRLDSLCRDSAEDDDSVQSPQESDNRHGADRGGAEEVSDRPNRGMPFPRFQIQRTNFREQNLDKFQESFQNVFRNVFRNFHNKFQNTSVRELKRP